MNLRDALAQAEEADGTAYDRYVLLRKAVEEFLCATHEEVQHGFLMLPGDGELWPDGGRVLFYRPGWSSEREVVCERRRTYTDWEYSVDPATLPGDTRYGPRGTR